MRKMKNERERERESVWGVHQELGKQEKCVQNSVSHSSKEGKVGQLSQKRYIFAGP